jgi:hypothetical protein
MSQGMRDLPREMMGIADGGRIAALRTRFHLYLIVHELVTKKFIYTEHADASAKASHFHLRLSVILLNSNSNSSGRVAKPAAPYLMQNVTQYAGSSVAVVLNALECQLPSQISIQKVILKRVYDDWSTG